MHIAPRIYLSEDVTPQFAHQYLGTPEMKAIHTKGAYILGYNYIWPYGGRPGKDKDDDLEESPIPSTCGERIPGISIEPCSNSSATDTGPYVITPRASTVV